MVAQFGRDRLRQRLASVRGAVVLVAFSIDRATALQRVKRLNKFDSKLPITPESLEGLSRRGDQLGPDEVFVTPSAILPVGLQA